MLFCAMALTLLGACHKPDNNPDIVVTFPPEFTVDLYEQRDAANGSPMFGLWVESTVVYDFSNYRIKAEAVVSSNAIAIEIQEVAKPDSGIGGPAPARGFVPIAVLGNGSYPFTISLHSLIVNEGTLTVQNGHYELSLPNAQGIDFQNRVLESLPDNYTWGYALAPAEPDVPAAEQFVASLKAVTSEPLLPPGYYGYFTVSGTGAYFFHKSIAPGTQNRAFLRHTGNSPDAVRGLLQTVRADPGKPLQVKCYSTFGEL